MLVQGLKPSFACSLVYLIRLIMPFDKTKCNYLMVVITSRPSRPLSCSLSTVLHAMCYLLGIHVFELEEFMLVGTDKVKGVPDKTGELFGMWW